MKSKTNMNIIKEYCKDLGCTIISKQWDNDYTPIKVRRKDGSIVNSCIAEMAVSALPDDYS